VAMPQLEVCKKGLVCLCLFAVHGASKDVSRRGSIISTRGSPPGFKGPLHPNLDRQAREHVMSPSCLYGVNKRFKPRSV
jgi:hypothetical protein